MPPEGPNRVVINGDVQEAKATRFWTNHRVSVAHIFRGCDDVLLLDHAVVHILI